MIRRAFVLTTAERQFGLVINFALVAIVSRLLTPEEIGVSVIGSSALVVAFSLREFATADFLIQQKELSRDDIRTSFTLLMLLTLLIGAGVLAVAPWVAEYYRESRLANFLRVVIGAGVLETFAQPVLALLRRNMAFGALAAINIATSTVMSLVTVLLALLGFSSMSFAWAWICSAAATLVLAQYFHGGIWMYRPCLRSWRSVIRFGSYNGVTTVLNRTYESIPQLILGRILPLSAVGHYNRSSVVSGIPDRVILASLPFVALPAFAAEYRDGRSLRSLYLRSISYITVLYWPAQVLFAFLAYPIIGIVLGQQWLEIAPIVQVMSLAAVFWFPCVLATPVLLSVGAVRDNLALSLLSRPVAAVVLCFASMFGVMAMALSQFVRLPFQMILALVFVRRHVSFAWRELLGVLVKSALVTLWSAMGPLAVAAWAGMRFDLGLGASGVAALLSASGWIGGLYVTRHPFLAEVRKILEIVIGSTTMRRALLRRRAPTTSAR